MRLVILTQDDPFYLARNIDYLLKKLPSYAEVVATVVFDVSPFGKRESFSEKMKKTYDIFGLPFFIRYGTKFVLSKLDSRNNVRKTLADRNIPLIHIEGNINKDENLEKLRAYKPDLLVSIAGNQIFKQKLLDVATYGCINLHTALLPKYRGLMPSFWVLKNKETHTGVSVFFVDEGIDSGPILVQDKLAIGNMSQAELIDVTKKMGMDAILKSIDKIHSGKYTLIENDASQMTYFTFPTKEDVKAFVTLGNGFIKRGRKVRKEERDERVHLFLLAYPPISPFLPSPPVFMNILTFDIEEWFHILDNASTRTESDWSRYESRIHQNMDLIFQILDETNSRATFFCLGWVADKHPDVIRRIDAAGYEIATHSYAHQLAYEQTPAQFQDDLVRSIQHLQDITGKKVRSYRAPGFSIKEYNRWVFPILVEQGIEIDCSVFSARRSHGGDASLGMFEPGYLNVGGTLLKEFPINTAPVLGQDLIFSGGGYFRLFPYSLIKSLMRRSPYVMTYFHPRDFDAKQPMIPGLSQMRKFKSYYGLQNCWPKLKQLLLEFPFVDLAEADRQVDWTKVIQRTV